MMTNLTETEHMLFFCKNMVGYNPQILFETRRNNSEMILYFSVGEQRYSVSVLFTHWQFKILKEQTVFTDCCYARYVDYIRLMYPDEPGHREYLLNTFHAVTH